MSISYMHISIFMYIYIVFYTYTYTQTRRKLKWNTRRYLFNKNYNSKEGKEEQIDMRYTEDKQYFCKCIANHIKNYIEYNSLKGREYEAGLKPK